MNKEIERKFLVKNMNFVQGAESHRIMQGYICTDNDRVVRVRIKDDKAFITIKNKTIGFSRDEFEYPVPVADAVAMLERVCLQPIIDKVRYLFPYKGHLWEIDVFERENSGLVIAEIELSSEEEKFEIPDFIGKEVTGDAHYYNACLVNNPYCKWK